MKKKAAIFDFNRTLYNPDLAELENGAIEILKYLKSKNFLLYLVARDIPERRELIKTLDIEKYFQKIIIRQEKSKVDFLECLRDAKLPSANFVVIGDRVTKEISIGMKLGMRTVWLKRGKFMHEKPENFSDGPDRVISDLVQIKDITFFLT